MSFSVILQKNTSPPNQLTKSLTTVSTLTGNLRHESNVVNPTIRIEYSGYPDCNYFTISEFNRSYFVTEIRSIRNDIWDLSGHCDVLSSFASEIRANTAIVRRQQNNWNLYLDDGTFKADVDPIIVLKSFPSGFTTYQYILMTATSS